MKKLILFALLTVVWLSSSQAQYRTERTGYEGDYFSLEGALDLFKQSSSLRDFERRVNTENNWVNNLDLNYDGRIDYIRVEHRRQGNYHAIILQALVDRYDIQDVAVIELEIIGRREAVLQIIGDEDLYGEEVIVEPVEGYSDSRSGYHRDYGDFVNVYYWRPVQYLLDRQYRVYVSPYRWHYYPTWWSPWRQYSWSIFRPRIVVYVNNYHIVRRHRVIRVHNFYRPYRTYCNIVVQRSNTVRVRQGRQPIYRPEPARRPNRGNGNDQGRGNVAERPTTTSPRPNISRTDPGLSRKRTTTTPRETEGRTTSPRPDQRSRNDVINPGRARSTDRTTTPRQSPSVNKRTTTDYNQKPSRNSSTRMERSTQSSTRARSSSSTSRMPTSREKVSGSSRVNRSSSPSVNKRSSTPSARSSTSTPSRTSTRSATPSRKPAVSSKRTAPAAKSNSSKKSSSGSSGSRSRRGGGEE